MAVGLGGVPTFVRDPQPAEFEALLEQRRSRGRAEAAALVLEVVSPDDERWEKVGFYSAHGVEELLIVDPQKRRVDWESLSGARYEPVERSGLIECGAAEPAERIGWPR
jgi:Uma2 family endonuclease